MNASYIYAYFFTSLLYAIYHYYNKYRQSIVIALYEYELIKPTHYIYRLYNLFEVEYHICDMY